MKCHGKPLSFASQSLLSISFLFLFLPTAVWSAEYLSVKGPCEISFPRDHGAHPGYRTEWWYYTGNVTGDSSRRFGFQLTFFRTQMVPPGAEQTWPSNPSAWRTNQLFLAHAAISDLEVRRFYHDEQMARGAVGLAGVEQQNDLTTIFLGRWSTNLGAREHRLRSFGQAFSLDLSCKSLKPVVLHGKQGYSIKGRNLKSASCYYSFTRLDTAGFITVNGKPEPVKGTSWMDHEFSSAPLEEGLVGWDWFSIQLRDNTELMIYLLRNRDGGYSEASSGTWVKGSGETLHLTHGDLKVEVLDYWKSPRSGATYPSRWRIRVILLELELMITPNLADQELVTSRSTQITYWEGSVSVTARSTDVLVGGVGYVEMTGYAKPFNLVP